MNKTLLYFLFFGLINLSIAQNDFKPVALVLKNKYPRAVSLSKNANSYDLMELRSYLGALNEIIKKTDNELYINMQIELVDNLINSAQVSSYISKNIYRAKDERFGWIVTKYRDDSMMYLEVPLYESYSFFYISEFLYLLKKNSWIDKSKENQIWWNNTLNFVEENIWLKWRERSKRVYGKNNTFFHRIRTHMGSHWAGIALYLNKMSTNHDIMSQTQEVVAHYDLLLKRNLKKKNGAYVWHSTYDDVTGTDAQADKSIVMQDGSHANHVIAYVVTSYELGSPNWKKKDIKYFSNTLSKIMYNKTSNTFADKVDGTPDSSRPGWGNNVGDGWVKLAKHNKRAKKILAKFSKNHEVVKKHGQELQFKAVIK